MIISEEYSLETIFADIDKNEKHKLSSSGKQFKLTSVRIKLFRTKGADCVTCGIKGKIFRLETHDVSINPHLNLYAENEEGELILMTKDHIIPKSKGGPNELQNYQPMCTKCNNAKADKM